MTYPGGAPNTERQPNQNTVEWPPPAGGIPHPRSTSSPDPTFLLPGHGTPSTYGTPQPQGTGWGQQSEPTGPTVASPPPWAADATVTPTGTAAAPPPPWAADATVTPTGRRLPLVPILAALSAVLFVAAVTMGVLYATKSRAVSQRDSALSAKTAELDKMRGDLQKANEDVGKLKTDLSGSQSQADELKRQKQVISKCFNLLGDMMQAASKGDKATVTKMQPEVDTACHEADRYID